MARKTEPVELSTDERRFLKTILRRGATTARVQTRARVLDLIHRGQHPTGIAATLSVSLPTVLNVKRGYLLEGLESALQEKPRAGTLRRIESDTLAKITALVCSAAAAGPQRLTLCLLACRAVERGFVESISHNAVRQILKKTGSLRT